MAQESDLSMPESMYDTAAEEKLCILADSEGLSIECVDTAVRTYWLYPGVTGWEQDKVYEWVEDTLSGYDYGITKFYEGPVEVQVYE